LSLANQGCTLAKGVDDGAIATVAVGFVDGAAVGAAIVGNRINTRGGASISPIGAAGATDVVGASGARLRRRGLMVGDTFVIGFAFLWRCGYRRMEIRP